MLGTLEVNEPVHGELCTDNVVHNLLQYAVGRFERKFICLHEQDLQDLVEVDEHPEVRYPLVVQFSEVVEVHASDQEHAQEVADGAGIELDRRQGLTRALVALECADDSPVIVGALPTDDPLVRRVTVLEHFALLRRAESLQTGLFVGAADEDFRLVGHADVALLRVQLAVLTDAILGAGWTRTNLRKWFERERTVVAILALIGFGILLAFFTWARVEDQVELFLAVV